MPTKINFPPDDVEEAISSSHLLNSSHLSALKLALNRIVNFLRCYLPLANAHANDFLTCDTWSNCIPTHIRQELLELNEVLNIPKLFLERKREMIVNSELRAEACRKLDSIVNEIIGKEPEVFVNGRHNKFTKPLWIHDSLDEFICSAAVCSLETILDDILIKEFTCSSSEAASVFVSHAMKVKKAHEVHIMSDACARVCQSLDINQIVDIGSGKGYLGTHLYLTHQLSVLEVDASSTNSSGAVNRRKKLSKRWNHLVQTSQSSTNKEIDRNQCSENDEPVSSSETGRCVSITAMISSGAQIEDLVDEHADLDHQSESFMLTGLHTCGGLACSMLRCFHQSSRCSALLNVGCCYHLMQEKYFHDPRFESTSSASSVNFMHLKKEEIDFPLSDYMDTLSSPHSHSQRRPFALGRNARVISAQSLERLVDPEDDKPLHVSMFQRVVLQKILHDQMGYTSDEWIVGRLRNKALDSPLDYVRSALHRLKFHQVSDQLTDDEIVSYFDNYSSCERELFSFYLLRCLLAPAIESCILLDRLIYLIEREHHAHIIRLFQPKTSPKCYAILATRNQTIK